MLIELSLHIKDKESTNTQSVSGIRCASQSSCTCTIFYFLQLARKCEAASDEGKCDREFFFSPGTYSRTGLSSFTSGTFAAGGTLKKKDFLVNTTKIRRTQEMLEGEISLNMPQGSQSGRKA